MKYLCTVTILSFLLITVCSAKSFSTKNFKHIYANFGTWQEYYMQVQDSQSGELNAFRFIPYFSLGVDYELSTEHLLIPEVGYVLRQNISSGDVTKDHFFLRLDYAYLPLDWLKLRIGTSFMWVTYGGSGKERTFPNGNSTETYYAPTERRNTLNQTLDLGVEFIQKELSFRLNSYIYAPNEEDQRLTSFSASFNYLIPIKDL